MATGGVLLQSPVKEIISMPVSVPLETIIKMKNSIMRQKAGVLQ
jgi:hypothetical protein